MTTYFITDNGMFTRCAKSLALLTGLHLVSIMCKHNVPIRTSFCYYAGSDNLVGYMVVNTGISVRMKTLSFA